MTYSVFSKKNGVANTLFFTSHILIYLLIITFYNCISKICFILMMVVGFLLGRICVLDQLDTPSCVSSDVNWKVFTSGICGLLYG